MTYRYKVEWWRNKEGGVQRKDKAIAKNTLTSCHYALKQCCRVLIRSNLSESGLVNQGLRVTVMCDSVINEQGTVVRLLRTQSLSLSLSCSFSPLSTLCSSYVSECASATLLRISACYVKPKWEWQTSSASHMVVFKGLISWKTRFSLIVVCKYC